MSISHETYAVCDGCGARERVTVMAYPAVWTSFKNRDGERAFCSVACMLSSSAAWYGPRQLQASFTRVLPFELTAEDVRMLSLVALGKSNKEVAFELQRAEATVKNRMTVVFDKLGVQDRIQAILRGHAIGVINLHKLSEQFSDQAKVRELPAELRAAA